MSSKEDHWSEKAYQNAASFVPALTTTVLQYLNPQQDDEILDIGCGDGVLTAKLAGLCRNVIGLDSSSSFIKTAKDKVSTKHPNAHFYEIDCRRLPLDGDIFSPGRYDRVFSNAAMHWILRDEGSRVPFFTDVSLIIKPGGYFVFEQGGFQNVSEAHTALISVLHLQHRIPLETIGKADPWFFPSDTWMRRTLVNAGFEVEKVELEHRSTRLTPNSSDGSGGLEGWVRLMGAVFLELLKEQSERDRAVQTVCSILQNVLTKQEDGSQWLGYVRLRAIARKPL